MAPVHLKEETTRFDLFFEKFGEGSLVASYQKIGGQFFQET
jgi:hypothetical protein